MMPSLFCSSYLFAKCKAIAAVHRKMEMNTLTDKKDTHRFCECLLLSYQMRCKIHHFHFVFLISNSQQYTFLLGLNSSEFSFSSYLALANRVPIEQRS